MSLPICGFIQVRDSEWAINYKIIGKFVLFKQVTTRLDSRFRIINAGVPRSIVLRKIVLSGFSTLLGIYTNSGQKVYK